MNEVKSKYEIFKQKAHIIIYGTNTVAGRLFDLILLGLILLSVVLVMLETVKEFDGKYHTFILISEWVITIFFTIEYILRIITIKKPINYILSFYGIIDLVAILPMYLSFFIVGTSVFTVIRALRLLRLFKILNHPQFSSQSVHLRESIIAIIQNIKPSSIFKSIGAFTRIDYCESWSYLGFHVLYFDKLYHHWFGNVCCRRR